MNKKETDRLNPNTDVQPEENDEEMTPEFRSSYFKIIQQSLVAAGNFLSTFCIFSMALYVFM